MRLVLLSTAVVLGLMAPAMAQGDDVCPSGQVNVNAAGSPVKCETDVTAKTPAPDVVEEAGEVVKDAGAAVKDAGEAVVDGVSDAVKDLTE